MFAKSLQFKWEGPHKEGRLVCWWCVVDGWWWVVCGLMGKWVISKVTEWGGSIQNACYTGEKAGIRVFIYEMMNPSETKQFSNEKQNSKMGESVVRFMYGTPVLELEAWFDNNWQWWQINKRYKSSMKLFHETAWMKVSVWGVPRSSDSKASLRPVCHVRRGDDHSNKAHSGRFEWGLGAEVSFSFGSLPQLSGTEKIAYRREI